MQCPLQPGGSPLTGPMAVTWQEVTPRASPGKQHHFCSLCCPSTEHIMDPGVMAWSCLKGTSGCQVVSRMWNHPALCEEQRWWEPVGGGMGGRDKRGAPQTYFLGKSTKSVTAKMMMRSKIISLYISCPTWVSQHWNQERNEPDLEQKKPGSTKITSSPQSCASGGHQPTLLWAPAQTWVFKPLGVPGVHSKKEDHLGFTPLLHGLFSQS